MLQTNPRNRLAAQQLLNHKWLKDNVVNLRLQQAYVLNQVDPNIIDDDDYTADLEKTLVNVSIHEDDENPPKRQKLK